MNWEDFKDLIESADGPDQPIQDFMEEYQTELFETGSVTVDDGGGGIYVVTVKVTKQ